VFSDPKQVVAENYFIDGEQRYQIIGMTKGLILLLVIYVDRSNPDLEIIRIISARKAAAPKALSGEESFDRLLFATNKFPDFSVRACTPW
jgi:uncharacterized DUF497 family protein